MNIAHRPRLRRVSLGRVVSEALSEGLNLHAAAERSEQVLWLTSGWLKITGRNRLTFQAIQHHRMTTHPLFRRNELTGRNRAQVRLQSAIHMTFNNPTADGIGKH